MENKIKEAIKIKDTKVTGELPPLFVGKFHLKNEISKSAVVVDLAAIELREKKKAIGIFIRKCADQNNRIEIFITYKEVPGKPIK